jgi:hypothetical protein
VLEPTVPASARLEDALAGRDPVPPCTAANSIDGLSASAHAFHCAGHRF